MARRRSTEHPAEEEVDTRLEVAEDLVQEVAAARQECVAAEVLHLVTEVVEVWDLLLVLDRWAWARVWQVDRWEETEVHRLVTTTITDTMEAPGRKVEALRKALTTILWTTMDKISQI